MHDLGKTAALTNRSGEVLTEIVASVEMSATQIQSIATAAEEQSATSEEINRSVEEINRITCETSRGVAQTVGAVHDLSEQLTTLNALIQDLKQG